MRIFPFMCLGLMLSLSPLSGQGKKPVRPGEVNTPPAKGERKADAIKVGDPAPDFTLPLLKTKGEATLSAYKGIKPVVLIFGSYT